MGAKSPPGLRHPRSAWLGRPRPCPWVALRRDGLQRGCATAGRAVRAAGGFVGVAALDEIGSIHGADLTQVEKASMIGCWG